ncbi:hypothetical protein ACFWF7_38550 [Nocardia sp. NPDC060256]|uniref:hypothetical protein n=1 Tax=Nocardia sp. NPDC060256 TaxID=3347086 RepID=UPI003655A5EF
MGPGPTGTPAAGGASTEGPDPASLAGAEFVGVQALIDNATASAAITRTGVGNRLDTGSKHRPFVAPV